VVFEDGFSFPFVEMARELYRVTKKGGVVVWVVNDQVKNGGETGSSFKQALKFMEIGFTLYDTMIYHKNGAPFPETGRYSQVFEYMFVFSKGTPKTINLLKDKPNRWAGHTNFGDPSKREKEGTLKKVDKFVISEFGTRYNVWYINNGKGFSSKDDIAFEHPAIFPESLAEDHILSWSNEGDYILDPMCGSGTTLKMSKLNNRNYVGIDINEEYVDLSNRRVNGLTPYNEENPNPKVKFLLSKKDALAKRKKKTNIEE
jgi:site-specific DNA-methyltransferase (adenine-specific)